MASPTRTTQIQDDPFIQWDQGKEVSSQERKDFFDKKNQEVRKVAHAYTRVRHLRMIADGLLTKEQVTELQSMPYHKALKREQAILLTKCQQLFKAPHPGELCNN
jgi:hypothetical protein